VLEVGDAVYSFRVTNGRAMAQRGAAHDRAVTVRGDQKALLGLFAHRSSVAAAIRQGAIRVTGDESALNRMLTHTRLAIAPPNKRREDGARSG
jgi:hypothetical protein